MKSDVQTLQQIQQTGGSKVKDEELMQIKIENRKYNDSMQYMFKRQKQLSSVIDDFYYKVVAENSYAESQS